MVVVGTAIFQFRISLIKQAEFSGMADYLSTNTIHSPRLLTITAKRKHAVEGDLESADIFYKRALANNPLFIPAWLGLAELRNDQGRGEESWEIVDYVDKLCTSIKRWRWEKALLAYQLGRNDILSKDLSYIIEHIPGKTKIKALKLAFSIWDEPADLLSYVGENNARHLLSYAVSEKQTQKAIHFWQYIKTEEIAGDQNDIHNFINLLLFDDHIHLAAKIWNTHFKDDVLLYNGNFVNKPINKAFGWRARKFVGGDWRIEKKRGDNGGGAHAYRVHFNGNKNLYFNHMQQIIPVEGGNEYILKSEIKTMRITTDQKPFIDIIGFRCDAPEYKTKMVEEDQPWTMTLLSFKVEENCDAVIVRLRRFVSDHIDSKISGDLWLKNIEIAMVSEANSVAN